MSHALLHGQKMLSIICPVCKAPLFEKEGQIKCLECNREVVVQQEDKIGSNTLENDIITTIDKLQNQLHVESDPTKIKDILISINTCVEILNKIGAGYGSK